MRTRIALFVVAFALLVVPGALADRSYSDPAGDSGVAPDITAVSVAHDSAGVVTLSVTTNQPSLAPGASFFGFVDTDTNATTGLPMHGLGAEHFFVADADGGVIFHVIGNRFTIDFDSTFSAAYSAGLLTARFQRSELGATERFAFLIDAEQSDADGNTVASDFAPDGPPFYEYSFAQQPLVLSVGKPAGVSPRAPLAGKAFVVTVPVTRSDDRTFDSGAVACTARIGRAPLRSTGRAVNGSARCSMRIPRGTRGKRLRGTINVSVPGAKPATRAFVFRIA